VVAASYSDGMLRVWDASKRALVEVGAVLVSERLHVVAGGAVLTDARLQQRRGAAVWLGQPGCTCMRPPAWHAPHTRAVSVTRRRTPGRWAAAARSSQAAPCCSPASANKAAV
jgi:hypothetical protein